MVLLAMKPTKATPIPSKQRGDNNASARHRFHSCTMLSVLRRFQITAGIKIQGLLGHYQLKAEAIRREPAEEVAVRIGVHAGKIYLDLADSERRVVEIDRNGWTIARRPPPFESSEEKVEAKHGVSPDEVEEIFLASPPDERTINRASDFWDDHRVADYPSEIVQFEVDSGERRTFVAIEKDLLEELENRARQSGVSIETLVNLWIQEKLAPFPSA